MRFILALNTMETCTADNLTVEQPLDLSSFPLLRPDQLHLYDYDVLLKSEEALSVIVSQEEDGVAHNNKGEDKKETSLATYAARLIELICREKACRRVKSLLGDQKVSEADGDSHASSSHSCNDNDERVFKISHDNEKVSESASASSAHTNIIRSIVPESGMKYSTTTGSSKEALEEAKGILNHLSKVKTSFTNSSPIRGKRKESKTKQRIVQKQNNRSINTSNFVVRSSNNNNRGSFRERAKVTKAAMKAKAAKLDYTSSDEYQKQLLDENKRKRRQLAIERIKERRIRRNKIWQEREERKRRQRAKREKIRESKQMAIIEEMEKMASKTKLLVVAKGETEDKANEAAANAATQVLENAKILDLESESESSLDSEIDESIVWTTEKDDTSACTSKDSSSTPNHFQPEDLVDNKDTCTGKTLSFDHVGEQSFERKETKETSNIGLPRAIESSQLHLGSEVENANAEISDTKVDTISRQVYVFQDSSKNEDLPSQDVEGLKSDKEVTWHPWGSNDSSSHAPESHSTITKYKFTKIFPTFHSIFTAFSGSTSRKKNDIVSQKERACLEYQIKTQRFLMGIACHTEGNVNDSFESFDALALKGCVREDLNVHIFKVSSCRQDVNSIISDVLCSLPQEETEWSDITNEHGVGNCWNLLWTWKKPKFDPEHVLACQKISRFKNTSPLTRKDFLKKQLQKFCAVKHCNAIMPLTFVLPGEYNAFISAFYSSQKKQDGKNLNIWIMKPVGMSRGRGISLVDDIGGVSYSLPSVIQKYISNPLLFHGYKFDLRLYVTVLSFSPALEAFIYKEGFARFGSHKFTARSDRLDDIKIHLTNSSIQKDYTAEIIATHPVRLAGSCGGGNKVKVSWLWKRLDALGLSSDIIWARITELCLKTLTAVCDEIPYQPNAFELFGFDIIIDNNLRPWLIEVNACPSLARDTNIDSDVKEALIEDTVKLVNPCKLDRLALKDICERRLYRSKKSSVKYVPERDQLEEDLRKIFCGTIPRQYGDFDEGLNYERLVPSP